MDYSDARLPDSFKTGGKWDSDKLGKALGTIAAHELAHSYSAGHKKNKTDGNKMNPTFWTELATKDYKLDATALAVIDDNLNKKSCKPEHIKDYAGVVVHWEEDIYPIPVDDAGLPLGLYSEPNTVELTFDYTIDTPYTGETFKFGWLGADSDMGMQDGSSEFDFITKAFLDSSFDSLITVFDGWAFNPALFYSGGTAGPAVILTLDWSEMHLSDYVLNWEGIHVARFIELIWDFDGIEGTDVTVRLNSKAYGGSNTTNGVTPIPEPSSILLFLFGLCGFSAVFKNPKRATN